MSKVKDTERILKAAREKHLVTYKEVPIRLSAGFSTETLQARRVWKEIFKVIKSKDLQPRLLYPEKLSFNIKGQLKSSQTKRVHHHQISIIRNDKGSSLRRRRGIEINNMNNKMTIHIYQ